MTSNDELDAASISGAPEGARLQNRGSENSAGIPSAVEEENDSIIRKLEKDCEELKMRCAQLKVQRNRLQSRCNGLKELLEYKQKQIQQSQAERVRLRKSRSYRLGNSIVRGMRLARQTLKTPLVIWRVFVKNTVSSTPAPGASSHLRIAHGVQAHTQNRHTLWNAYRLALQESWREALEFAEKHAEAAERSALHLLRANVAESDGEWLKELNAYLNENGTKGNVSLRSTGGGRFHRLFSNVIQSHADGPLVSVIMPAFNAENTLRLAVRSILDQTHGNLELIIVDDCSSDATYSIASALAKEDGRVKVLQNAVNVGPYVSKNLALRVAKGEYLTGHDADDWAHPQRLEQDLESLVSSKGQVLATVSNMLRMTVDGEFNWFSRVGRFSKDGACRVASISFLIESRYFRDVLGGWDSVRFGADSELISRAEKVMGERFRRLGHIGMCCLDSETNLTRDSVLGISKINGASAVRKQYKQSFEEWHAGIDEDSAKLSFPQTERNFRAPDAMVVPADRIQINCDRHDYGCYK